MKVMIIDASSTMEQFFAQFSRDKINVPIDRSVVMHDQTLVADVFVIIIIGDLPQPIHLLASTDHI